MNLLQAILFGAVFGISEILPISSSGHMAILRTLFHCDAPSPLFYALVYLFLAAAVVVSCKQEIPALVRAFGRGGKDDPRSRRMLWFLLLGSLPLILAPLFYGVAAPLYYNLLMISVGMLASGLLLFFIDRFFGGDKDDRTMTLPDALLIGTGQLFSVIPGYSRIGMALSVSAVREFQTAFSLKFALLLSVPAMLGGAIYSLFGVFSAPFSASELLPALLGAAAAGLAGFAAIKWLHAIVNRFGVGVFCYYAWGSGLIALFLSLIS